MKIYVVYTKGATLETLLCEDFFKTKSSAIKFVKEAAEDYPDHEPLIVYKLTIKKELVK